MKLIVYLFQFISEKYSASDPPIAGARELPKNQSRSTHLLIGYRSPNDQLQVVAIPRCQAEEWPKSDFPNSTY